MPTGAPDTRPVELYVLLTSVSSVKSSRWWHSIHLGGSFFKSSMLISVISSTISSSLL